MAGAGFSNAIVSTEPSAVFGISRPAARFARLGAARAENCLTIP
jgi:hypothetical protein